MLPMTVLRRFDCVLAPTKTKVLAEYAKRTGGKLEGDALDRKLNHAAGQSSDRGWYFGMAIAWSGFALWYFKVQRYLDLELKSASEAKRSPGPSTIVPGDPNRAEQGE